jgi:hypothetical protein
MKRLYSKSTRGQSALLILSCHLILRTLITNEVELTSHYSVFRVTYLHMSCRHLWNYVDNDIHMSLLYLCTSHFDCSHACFFHIRRYLKDGNRTTNSRETTSHAELKIGLNATYLLLIYFSRLVNFGSIGGGTTSNEYTSLKVGRHKWIRPWNISWDNNPNPLLRIHVGNV